MSIRGMSTSCCIIALFATGFTGTAQDNGPTTPGLALYETGLMSRIDDRIVQLDFGVAAGFGGDKYGGFAPNGGKLRALTTIVLFDGRLRLTGGTDNYLVDDADRSTPVFGVSGTLYEVGSMAWGAKYLYRDVSYDRHINHEFLHCFEIGATWRFPSIVLTVNPGFALADNGIKYLMLSGGIAPKLSKHFWFLIDFNKLGFLTQQDHYGFFWLGLRYATDHFTIDYGTYVLGHRFDMSIYF